MSDGSPDIRVELPYGGATVFERRSAWRLFLDRLGLRYRPERQQAGLK